MPPKLNSLSDYDGAAMHLGLVEQDDPVHLKLIAATYQRKVEDLTTAAARAVGLEGRRNGRVPVP